MSDDWKPYTPQPGAAAAGAEPLWKEPYGAEERGAVYDSLAAEALASSVRFDRGFRTRVFTVDGGWISLTELDDDFHEMRVALKIGPDGEIADAAGRMIRNPYDMCPRALESLRGLVGANIARPSAHNQIKQRMPRTEGCLHVADMLTIAFRAFRISKGHDIEPEYGGESTRRMLLNMLPNMRDTCVSFAIEHPERG
jgi:hypothetical protein